MRKSMHEMEYSFTLPGLRRRSPWDISIVPVGNQIADSARLTRVLSALAATRRLPGSECLALPAVAS